VRSGRARARRTFQRADERRESVVEEGLQLGLVVEEPTNGGRRLHSSIPEAEVEKYIARRCVPRELNELAREAVCSVGTDDAAIRVERGDRVPVDEEPDTQRVAAYCTDVPDVRA